VSNAKTSKRHEMPQSKCQKIDVVRIIPGIPLPRSRGVVLLFYFGFHHLNTTLVQFLSLEIVQDFNLSPILMRVWWSFNSLSIHYLCHLFVHAHLQHFWFVGIRSSSHLRRQIA
jgi:hypothetical protein